MQKNVWNDVLKKLEKRINRPSFNTWIRPTSLVSITQYNVRVGVPDEVFVYWLGEYYVDVMADILSEILGFQPEISFVVMENNVLTTEDGTEAPKKENSNTPIASLQTKTDSRQKTLFPSSKPVRQKHFTPEQSKNYVNSNLRRNSTFAVLPKQTGNQNTTAYTTVPGSAKVMHDYGSRSLNARYTFESYVVGSNNRFAHAAGLAVAEQMAVNYNPLFIYGGVGLGKTHLLHAIGNHVASLHRTDRILYLSSEQFINEEVN